MSQNTIVIADGSGATVLQEMNNALNSVTTWFAGPAAPNPSYPGMGWLDTTANLVKQRNQANTAWITLGTLDVANWGLLPLAGGTLTGALTLAGNPIAALHPATKQYVDALPTKELVQSGSLIYAQTSGTDIYNAIFSPAITAYTTGMLVNLYFTLANTVTTPTINLNNLGAKTIVRLTPSGATVALNAGDIIAGHKALLHYDGTYFVLFNPAYPVVHDHSTTAKGGAVPYASVTGLGLGAWNVTPVKDTVYQAATDLFVNARGVGNGGNFVWAGYTDASNPPTTIVDQNGGSGGAGWDYANLSFFVKKGHYWKVADTSGISNSVTISVIPLGS